MPPKLPGAAKGGGLSSLGAVASVAKAVVPQAPKMPKLAMELDAEQVGFPPGAR